MKVQSINLLGPLLLGGLTASPGKVIQNSGGQLTWGTASVSAAGGVVKNSGHNYLFVKTVNTGNQSADMITNGDNLLAAYQTAKTLNVGQLSPTNRITLLLLPGDYDLYNNSFEFDTSYIDIVGFSKNPNDTILRSTAQPHLIIYNDNIDSKLENVQLVAPSSSSIYNNGTAGQYLRWKNVIVNGPCTYNSGSATFYWDDLNGEFYDIKVMNTNSNFPSASTSISGIFENIEVDSNSTSSFFVNTGGSITGTFSNIKTSAQDSFYNQSQDGDILGHFENIEITSSSTKNFDGLNINGEFKNIRVQGGGYIFRAGGNITGKFENISVFSDTTPDVFNSTGTINIIAENIYIKKCTAFLVATTSILGEYRKIQVDEIQQLSSPASISSNEINIILKDSRFLFTGAILIATDTVYGEYRDLYFGYVNGDIFLAEDGFSGPSISFDGVYENIKIDYINGDCFKSDNNFFGHYKNIYIPNFQYDCFYGTLMLNAHLEKVKVDSTTGGSVMSSANYIIGTFSDITVNKAATLFTTSGTVSGYFEDLTLGNVENTSGSIFYASGDINATVKNVYSSYAQKYFLVSTAGNLNVVAKNIYLNSVITSAFCGAFGVYGKYQDIIIPGNVASLFQTSYNLNIEVDNLKLQLPDGLSDIFQGADIYGTYSNIYIYTGASNVFNANVGFGGISGTFKNIVIEQLSNSSIYYVFWGASCSVYMENFHIKDRFYAVFGGKMVNCTIDQSGYSEAFEVYGGSIIESSKILGYLPGPPDYSIVTAAGVGFPQITYTLTSRPDDGNTIANPYNYEI